MIYEGAPWAGERVVSDGLFGLVVALILVGVFMSAKPSQKKRSEKEKTLSKRKDAKTVKERQLALKRKQHKRLNQRKKRKRR